MPSDSNRTNNIPLSLNIPTTYLVISQSQFQVLALLPHFIAPLSVLGSLAIIYRILQFDRHEIDASSRRCYHRLLIAMSICDTIGSTAFAFGTIPVPRETMLDMARGTTATCTAQGFFIHICVSAVLYYNAGLMIYFVVTIRYGWTDSYAAQWLEPIIHIWSLVVPFGQGVAGLFLDIFNPLGFGSFCEISPYPVLCAIFENCTRGKSATYLLTLFNTLPECILLIIIYVSITLIYCTVRSQARRALSITANRERIRARSRSVAVQSWLFAAIFFNTWVYAIISPLLDYVFSLSKSSFIEAQYALGVLTLTFLPLQGFFNFCIYIRPRLVRLWRDQQLSFCAALKLAVFGGRETGMTHRRSSLIQQRKRSSQFLPPIVTPDTQQPEVSAATTVGQNTPVSSSEQQSIYLQPEVEPAVGEMAVVPRSSQMSTNMPCSETNDLITTFESRAAAQTEIELEM